MIKVQNHPPWGTDKYFKEESVFLMQVAVLKEEKLN